MRNQNQEFKVTVEDAMDALAAEVFSKPVRKANAQVPSFGTGQLHMPAEKAPKRYAIRFHFRSGKHIDMNIREFDQHGNRNGLYQAQRVMEAVDRNLADNQCWIGKDDEETSQNFRVYESALEFIELVEI